MNKNPFAVTPAYTPPQPPLPPGPPPPQPAQPDYSAYWAAAAAQQAQQPGAYNPQWPGAAAAPAPRPTPEQSALYANYGYGGQQNISWQQQQQRQAQQHFQPPPPVVQPPPPPQAAYNPYQPQTASFQQQYMAQTPAVPPVPHQPAYQPQVPVQQFQHPQPQFFPQQQPQQQQQQQQQQQGNRHPNNRQQNAHHMSPQSQPPAKRQRFDGPNQHRGQPSQPQFQAPAPPTGPQAQNGPLGGGVGVSAGGSGGPFGPNQPQGRSGGSGQGLNNRGSFGPGRGGGGGGMGRGGRGGNMGMARGGNRGRGGMYNNVGGRGGSMQGGGSFRGHGGNRTFGNRESRRGGSFNAGGQGFGQQQQQQHHHQNFPGGPSFRGRNQSFGNAARGSRHDSNIPHGPREGQSSVNSRQKEENRRTLTDFKLVGLEIPSLSWTWGVIPSETSHSDIDEEIADATTSAAEADTVQNAATESNGGESVTVKSEQSVSAVPPPPSRIRIYFHTPVTADDSHPITPQSSFTLGQSVEPVTRKGKRKKLEDDDGDIEEGRGPPPPPPGMSSADVDGNESLQGRDSVAPSVAETASEGDWLMAAIGDDDVEDSGDGDHTLIIDHAHGEEPDVGEEYVDADGYNDHGHDGQNVSGDDIHHESEGVNGQTAQALRASSPTAGSPLKSPALDATQPVPDSNLPTSADNVSGSAPDVVPEGAPIDTSNSVQTHVVSKNIETTAPLQPSDSLSTIPDTNDHGDTSPYASTILEDDSHPATGMLDAVEGSTSGAPPDDHDQEQVVVSSGAPKSEASSKPSGSETKAKVDGAPSANRLSISFAAGTRRMVIDAEVVDSLKVKRSQCRIEVHMNVIQENNRFKGIVVEALTEATTYTALDIMTNYAADPTIPPFVQAANPSKIVLIVHLDKDRPLSEPRWVKTGDVNDWLKSMFGRMFWVAGAAAEGWEKKIEVVDPDPPPTIWTVLEAWSNNSNVGVQIERQRFLRTHMTETDNILEILLRLVRGERASYTQSTANISPPNVSGPLLSALSQGSAHGAQQTHVSLAVLAIFRLSVEYAKKALGDAGKDEVEDRVGEIIRSLPSHLIYKSLDGIFKEWKVEKKGGR
ncbi:hypothetical protein ABKN59_000121 [Abortiporus biennis]